MKQRRFLALLLCTALGLTSISVTAFADAEKPTQETMKNTLSYEDYNLKWSDEFDGSTLNRDNWNVETHEAGWVNSELQEYVDSDDNISVHDGSLYITPIKNTETVADAFTGNLIQNADFSSGMTGWTETIANWGGDYVTDASSSTGSGKITYVINNPGTEDWHIQLKQSGVALEAGKTYVASYTVNSTVARSIKSGVMSTSYNWYGGSDPAIEADKDTDISFEFTMTDADPAADFYISLGKVGDTPAGTVTISNIYLHEKTESTDSTATKENVTYTSGRISTQNKETFTYGLFEVRAKVPAGQGYLPAFWLMANDENTYGQWPRCGEIDCMEVMGQDTKTAYGTIHYGNPHSQSQGTYTLSDEASSFSDEYHTYSCEWEPGVIRWYIDGNLFHEESDWYSTTVGQGTVAYPAPFDQPFYIILNLAVGGSWVGYPDETTSFDNNPYVIDYVRVYQKDSYDENVTAPVKETVIRDADSNGNYINNGDFSVAEDLTDDNDWKFLTALGGEATAEIANNEMLIKTTNEGTVDYSVQLVQPNIPFIKGATYQVQFDAYASEARDIGVDIKAPDHGYTTYMPSATASLTTEKQTYTYTFEMKDATDSNGRLEYNMGAKGSTADIHISNVSVKMIKAADPNAKEEKTVLSNGNYVYNGKFQEGSGHLGYWDVETTGNPTYSVSSLSDGRRLYTILNKNQSLTLKQDDLAISEGNPYLFSMDVTSDTASEAKVTIGGNSYKLDLVSGTKTYTVKVPQTASLKDKNLAISFAKAGSYYIDNISITENALIKNGNFNDGTTGYEVYIDSSAKASYVVDSLSEDNALDITVNNTSDQDWKIQVKQNDVPLEKGKSYTLSFKAKSSIPRSIRVIMQGTESRNWDVYSSDNIVALTSEYQTFTDTFTMEKDTDLNAFLSICLGKVTDEISDQHRVVIDDISLVDNSVSDSTAETETKTDTDSKKNTPSQTPATGNSDSQSASSTTDKTPAASTDTASSTVTKTDDKKTVSKTETGKSDSANTEKAEDSAEETIEDATTPASSEEKSSDTSADKDSDTSQASDSDASGTTQVAESTGFWQAIINAIKNFFSKIFSIFK